MDENWESKEILVVPYKASKYGWVFSKYDKKTQDLRGFNAEDFGLLIIKLQFKWWVICSLKICTITENCKNWKQKTLQQVKGKHITHNMC